MSTEPPLPTGYLFSDDLLWISRVMGVAKDVGCKIIPARTVEQLGKAVAQHGPRCVLIDLGHQAMSQDPTPVIEQIKATGPTRLVAYGSHIETAQLAAARKAGCSPVLARSKMADQLAELLPEWLQDE
jgi:DNA-binding NarL/FixJ family response regulator